MARDAGRGTFLSDGPCAGRPGRPCFLPDGVGRGEGGRVPVSWGVPFLPFGSVHHLLGIYTVLPVAGTSPHSPWRGGWGDFRAPAL